MSADHAPPEDQTPRPLEIIANVLADFDTVDTLDTRDNRYPPRLTVSLTVTNLDDAPGVTDVIDTYDARIKSPRLSTSGEGRLRLQFDLEVPRPFVQDGTPKLRENGSSRVASMSKDAVARAGFALGDEIAVLVRPGEVRLIHADQWPDDTDVLPEDDLLPGGFYQG